MATGRPPPDDDPQFLARAASLRKAPRAGEVVEPRRRVPTEDDVLDEGPLAEDIERFSGVTRTCPACKKDVFDDSAVCYHCGHAFERTTEGSTRVPVWAIVTVAVLAVALALGLALRIF